MAGQRDVDSFAFSIKSVESERSHMFIALSTVFVTFMCSLCIV